MTGDVSLSLWWGNSFTECSSWSMVHSWSHHFSSCPFSDMFDELPGDASGFGLRVILDGSSVLSGDAGFSGLSTGLSQTMVELTLSEVIELASV